MKPVWLLREGDVLASADVVESAVDRVRGMAGRPHLDGALLITRARFGHTVGVHFPLDVAFLDRQLVVLDVVRLKRWRVAVPRLRAWHVLEAEAGAFERWHLRVGDQLEIREPT